MKKLLPAFLLSLALAAAPAAAQERPAPRLVVAIAVDQLGADLYERYRPHFTGGLGRLSRGTVFTSGWQGHAATETCPGHSTILTGSRPSRTGIIANNWFDLGAARDDKYIYCAEDPRIPGSASNNYTLSSYHLQVPAMGDLMKRADPRARVVTVTGKDRAAAMMGGHGPDERWWWGGTEFVTHEGRPAPRAVGLVNANVAAAIARPMAPLELPDLCRARSRAVAVEGGGRPVGEHRFAREAGDSRAFRASPELDGATLALAAGLRAEMRLGEGAATDLLILGLSANDYVGHGFGTGGAEMCLQLLSLDRSLGDFFAHLDRTGVDYVAVLTADHGGLDIPERAREEGAHGAARVDPALHANAMSAAIGARLGLQGRLVWGDGAFGDMYVDRNLPPEQRRRVLDEAVRAYRAHPQVAAVLTAAEIMATPQPTGSPAGWTMLQRARASHFPGRSGDFLVLLEEQVTPIFDTSRGYVSTHGSPWDYDRRVPILFWRQGMAPSDRAEAIETADILPTLAALVRLPIAPGTIDGRCRDIGEARCPRADERD
ncbi:MAG: alkaline phosphatase family protein [Allosphingosinicella sp.]|uniref:alkaline phosphatase family protein n=1 Tax=Allosphingosinicella sp. TaxID=2823234 RepID=UPI00393023A8